MSGLGPRQMFLLDELCKPIAQAFEATPYLVGIAATSSDGSFRDVDIRLMLPDEQFDSLRAAIGLDAIRFLSLIFSQYMADRTNMPIDFQFQRLTEANDIHGNKSRNPLGCRRLSNYRGDANPKE